MRKNRLVVGGEGARLGQNAVILLGNHRQRALRQIAEIVGEIGIDASDNGFVIIVAILPERHLAKEEVAHLIDAILIGEIEGIDDVADRFRHLFALVEQKAVGIDALLHRNARRHQEGRPVHRVKADDVLADDVHIGRPVAPVRIAFIGKADAGDVVGQGVEPDIHDMLGIVRDLDAPVECGPRNRQISQSAFDEADNFVPARVGADEIRLSGIERE